FLFQLLLLSFFFFSDPTPTCIYPLSLHDALPILPLCSTGSAGADRRRAISSARAATCAVSGSRGHGSSRRIPISKPPETWSSVRDRKSTRLNSSHVAISYAVFCLKKKKNNSKKQK